MRECGVCVCVTERRGGNVKVQWKKYDTELEILLFNLDLDTNLLIIYRIFQSLCPQFLNYKNQ